MASRFYFPVSEAAAITPAFDSGWSSNAGAVRRRLSHNKGSSALTTGESVSLSGAAGFRKINRQYISDRLDPQTISGTVKMYMLCQEVASNDNVNELCICIKVVSGDGLTERGTLLSVGNYGNTTEFNSVAMRNEIGADGDAITSVTAEDGDRLVVEIGFGETGTGTTPAASGKYGETGTDLAENETDTTGVPWIQFSGDIVMRATRFWFPAIEAAAVSPSFAGWTDTSQALRRRMAHSKGVSGLANGTTINLSGTAADQDLDRQYVSDPIKAGTIGGSIRCQLRVQEILIEDNVDRGILCIKVVSNDGQTIRGTILALGNYAGTSEFNTSLTRNKTFADGDALTPVDAQDGDRLVVEIGYSNSTAGTSPQARATYGEAGTDLGIDETDTGLKPGWIDFCVGEFEMYQAVAENQPLQAPMDSRFLAPY